MQKFVVKKSKSAPTQETAASQVKMTGYLKKKRNVSNWMDWMEWDWPEAVLIIEMWSTTMHILPIRIVRACGISGVGWHIEQHVILTAIQCSSSRRWAAGENCGLCYKINCCFRTRQKRIMRRNWRRSRMCWILCQEPSFDQQRGRDSSSKHRQIWFTPT